MESPLQKALARAGQASRHAAKKAERKKVNTFKDEKWAYQYRSKIQNAQILRMKKQAEHNWKEDWAVGTRLLPRRDIGKSKFAFGTMPSDILYNPTVPEKWRKQKWLAEGDRVVITAGRDRGKIGKVDQVSEDSHSVRVEKLNEVNYVVPEFLAQERGKEYTPTVVTSRVMSWDDVKLVHAVKDEAGYFRDVVVDEIRLIGGPKAKKPKRIIPGLELEVPWPNEEEPEHEDTDADTLRLTVDERTFEPTLNEMPMPPSVIDELRGKYSKFRTRHDPEWIARKEAEQAQLRLDEKAVEHMGSTPLVKQAAEFNARPKPALPELTEEQLAAIGESMMKELPERSAKILKRMEEAESQ
ncbi:hypothetical protein K461DRAFT_277930 [Myriangium duriaei CBS 260.36]|uniref:KOW domain-containing protein n=1 Tax=Myriangium duriaei CBS 260.36 TaxID=1168546 RepID=A0A9P4J0A1_9PEZI|nr:hypothetical protein K461DRAFT_277930 [Myriangium duriaei CBS 260.36]